MNNSPGTRKSRDKFNKMAAPQPLPLPTAAREAYDFIDETYKAYTLRNGPWYDPGQQEQTWYDPGQQEHINERHKTVGIYFFGFAAIFYCRFTLPPPPPLLWRAPVRSNASTY